jgi:predicted CopG family antitoxin
MHGLCTATKTISIEIDAYELLKQEKRSERESFS